VKIENHRHAALRDQSFKHRRTKQCSFAQDVDQIILLRFANERQPAAEAARNEPELLPHHAALVKKRVQIFVFERSEGDVNTTFAKQRFPLFEAITLAWRSVVERGHQGENTHNYSVKVSIHPQITQTK